LIKRLQVPILFFPSPSHNTDSMDLHEYTDFYLQCKNDNPNATTDEIIQKYKSISKQGKQAMNNEYTFGERIYALQHAHWEEYRTDYICFHSLI